MGGARWGHDGRHDSIDRWSACSIARGSLRCSTAQGLRGFCLGAFDEIRHVTDRKALHTTQLCGVAGGAGYGLIFLDKKQRR